MTFKEKLKQEHPEKLDNGCGGGCIGCPTDYGYEKEKSKDCKGGYCDVCWNREMPELMTAEEAWDIAKKLFAGFSDTELDEIFGKGWSYPKLMELSPYEAKAKIDEWENKQIRVGDVVYCFADCDNEWRNNEEHYGVVTNIYPNTYHVLMKNGDCSDFQKDELEKTGKHIDIQSVLEQIVKEE